MAESRTALTGAVAALLAAASTFVLPAWDAVLPGGAIVWQVGTLALALAAALWVRRRLPPGTSRTGARLVRLVATTALLLALVWAGCVGLLWLLWPR